MSHLKHLECSKTNIKIVRDEQGKMIKTAQGILCEQVDRDGNTTLTFAKTVSNATTSNAATSNATTSNAATSNATTNNAATSNATTSNASSLSLDKDAMPCSTASLYNAKTIQEKESNMWPNDDCKELLQLYFENIEKVGPFNKFKNKKQMWEFISNEITTKCSIAYSSAQCENKYKNMLKKRNVAKKRNRQSGNEKSDVDFEDEFELISSIDDNIEPEVCFGIGQYTIKKTKFSTSNEEEEGGKIQKSQNIFVLLENLHNKKEEEKERRHREKLEVLRELFSKNN